MKSYCSEEVMKWLRENAYLAKDDDYYAFDDFPNGMPPDKIHIPLSLVGQRRLAEQMLKGVEPKERRRK